MERKLNPLLASKLLLCGALIGCTSPDSVVDTAPLGISIIAFSPMYSAFDGTHEFAVTPSVPAAATPGPMDVDPLIASTIKWEVDSAFVKQDEFSGLPTAIKLISKKAGQTEVRVTAKTLKGFSIHSAAKLT